ncbi:hypothetical protein LV79_002975 [Actinokineospora globicatena]|nr:hypothetical protein [Actinokineospora globicatena]
MALQLRAALAMGASTWVAMWAMRRAGRSASDQEGDSGVAR